MNPSRIVECAFFIPLRRDARISDGELHPADAWNWLTTEMFTHFDGWTIAPGVYEGVWKNPTGEQVADQSRKYIVAIPEDRTGELTRILSEACAVFHQQAIYLNVAGRVEFVEAPADEGTV